MRLKKLFVLLLLIVSVGMNIFLLNSMQTTPSLSIGNAELYLEEMNNIKVNVAKIVQVEDSIEFVVDVNGLKDDKLYTISLVSAHESSGVTLSEGNVLMRVGEVVNEMQFIPTNTRLNFWTTHPRRIINDNVMYFRIVDERNVEVFKMEI
ncbi:hypothetical protein PA598K_06435 [Paenibacillus sp. 598K]|uniref:hypothetical protein n=1 Tax=Paenibacillus sp. 598K TaxID=1117987 RepID=UPI000FF9BAC8|nr:hypothetical protein [Paenibacillus sp. 598K]GBF77858.1 hypothetical protein PA598K_06435 [Paenibacillus sp. 598K]